MSLKTEYSRMVLKRTALSGSTPTISTATTINDSWVPTDIMIGELFLNIADDRLFTRTNNGILEIEMVASGSTGDYLPLTGGSMTGDFTAQTITIDSGEAINGATNLKLYTQDGISTGQRIEMGGSNGVLIFNADVTKNIILYSSGITETFFDSGGNTYTLYEGGSYNGYKLTRADGNEFNIITTSPTTSSFNTPDYASDSIILSSRNSQINSSVSNSAIIGGANITASTSNTLYCQGLNVNGTLTLNGNSMSIIQGSYRDSLTGTTSNATPTTLFTISGVNNNVVNLKATVVGRSSSESYSCTFEGLYRGTGGGTPSLIGAVTKVENTSNASISFDVTPSNTAGIIGNLELDVTGLAATNFNWVIIFDFTGIS